MAKIFSFNEKLDGSYIDPISGAAGTNTNGVFERTEKGMAWKAHGTNGIITYPYNSNYVFGTSEFWVEFYGKNDGKATFQSIVDTRNLSSGGSGFAVGYYDTGAISVYIQGTAGNSGFKKSTIRCFDNKWHHVLSVSYTHLTLPTN